MRPKPMVPIVNKPVMEHILDLLKRHGIFEVIVTLQYLAPVVQDYFGDGSAFGMKITYSVEDIPLGTAGSVRNAARHLNETFIVVSGDALTDFDLEAVVAFHRERKALATLTLYRVTNPLEYGVIIVDDEGRVQQFLEKPSWSEVFSDTVNTGIYVLEPEIFSFYEAGKAVDFSQDVFPSLLRNGQPLYGYIADGYWCDVGNLAEYLRANADVLEGKVRVEPLGVRLAENLWSASGDVDIAEDAQFYGPVWLGNSVRVHEGAIIHGPTVIRDSSVVGAGAHINRSVIWRGTYIGERSQVRGAVVGKQCVVKPKANIFEGAVIGDHTVVGEGAIVRPNVKIWPSKVIEAGAVVASSVVWGTQVRRSLFGRFGASGLVNVDLIPEFATKLGVAYGAVLPRGSVVTINRDPHRTARMVKRAIISGLPSAGVNVWDLKTVPVPVARYVTRVSPAVGGIHVRVSPFDPRVIDIKFFDHRGLDIDRTTERKIENSFFREDFRRVDIDQIGAIVDAPGLSQEYVDAYLKAIRKSAFAGDRRATVVIDYAGSTISQVLPSIFAKLHGNLSLVALNSSVDEAALTFSATKREEALNILATISMALRADLGVRFDPGGERVYLADGRGSVLRGWTALAATMVLLGSAGRTGCVGVPVTAPSIFESLAREQGMEVIRTKASHQALMAAAVREGMVLLGDDDGSIIFPEFQASADGLFAVGKILELLLQLGVRLEEIVVHIPPYYLSKLEVACPFEEKGRVMRGLFESHQHLTTDRTDGIKFFLDDRWVLVLPDAERPALHVLAEGPSHHDADLLAEEFAAEIRRLLDLHAVR
jgi:mannose-1-phosphate guanylyltransferase/phosphomannomutase